MLAPVPLQRLEGVVLLAAGVAGFAHSGWSWLWFAGLLLVPDISMAGYLLRPTTGAISYNAGHTLVGPALLLAWFWVGAPTVVLVLASTWLAHIGLDRALGYGLKFADSFNHTHLGEIGRYRGR